MRAEAMVQHGPRDLRETVLDLPGELAPGSALVRVEACGLCGSDVEALKGEGWATYPRIIGHEIVGTIEKLGPGGRRDVKLGDRVAIEPWLPCGQCRHCLAGEHQFCTGWAFERTRFACYGYITLDNDPQLWGGYSTHVYVHPRTVLYPVPEGVDPALATLWNPLAAGIQWGAITPGTTYGSSIAILGCGQRGLAAVIAARAAGASTVIASGLSRDAHKLALAKELGADHVVDVEREDVLELVSHLTDGEGVDAVVDTSAAAAQPVRDALALVRRGGTIVLAGLKMKPVDGVPIDDAIQKGISLRGVLGMSATAHRRAVEMIASRQVPVERLRTHTFDYREAVRAIDTLSGAVPGDGVINVGLSIG